MKKINFDARKRALRVQRRRERNRAKRSRRNYVPIFPTQLHSGEKPQGPIKGPRTPPRPVIAISVPPVFDIHINPEDVFTVLNEIRTAIVSEDRVNVRVDISSLERIGPEATMLLLAEIERCAQFCKGKQILGNFPSSNAATTMLNLVGYFEYFSIRAPKLTGKQENILKIRSGTMNDPVTADSLLEVFEKYANFDPEFRKTLFAALVECMGNVKLHAYNDSCAGIPHKIKDKWWLVGYCLPKLKTLSFSIFDQGSGIPSTISTSPAHRINVNGLSQSEIVERAVTEGYSRLGNDRRGTGLPSLLNMIRGASDGSLKIISNRANNSYSTKDGLRFDSSVGLEGTLISWSLKT